MPKQKTHSGAKKRFKVTGSGKLMRERANKRGTSSRSSPAGAPVASPAPPRARARRHQEGQEASRPLSADPPTSIAGPVRPVHEAGEHPWHA